MIEIDETNQRTDKRSKEGKSRFENSNNVDIDGDDESDEADANNHKTRFAHKISERPVRCVFLRLDRFAAIAKISRPGFGQTNQSEIDRRQRLIKLCGRLLF